MSRTNPTSKPVSSSASDSNPPASSSGEKSRPLGPALLFSGALLLGGCVSLETVAPPVTPALAARTRGDVSTLATGRSIYLVQCTSCHAPESVSAHAGKWPGIIRDMAQRSKLSPAQEQAVLAYVLAASR